MIEGLAFVMAAALYLAVSFGIAWAADRRWVPARLTGSGWILGLGLAVSVTTWTYYGAVASARELGMWFLATYVGAMLAFALYPVLIRPIARLSRRYALHSLADLLAYRYRSGGVGALVTALLTLSVLPYMALQIEAIERSARVFGGSMGSPLGPVLVLLVALFIIAFCLGIPMLERRRDGLLAAVALATVVKLAGLWVGAGALLWLAWDGPGPMVAWLEASGQGAELLRATPTGRQWHLLLGLSLFAAFLLPRQFHLLFGQAHREAALRRAAWVYPLLLSLFALPLPVLHWAGQRLAGDWAVEIGWVAALAGQPEGGAWAGLVVFVGGFAAGSAMLTVSTVAIAHMLASHGLAPLLSLSRDRGLVARMRLWRAVLALGVLGAALQIQAWFAGDANLTALAVSSLIGLAQCLPATLGALFWQRASRAGALAGMAVGSTLWLGLTLLCPTCPWMDVLLASVLANASVLVGLSLWVGQRPSEQRAAANCRFIPRLPEPLLEVGLGMEDLLGAERAVEVLRSSGGEVPTGQGGRARLTRTLSAVVGPSVARRLVRTGGFGMHDVAPQERDGVRDLGRRLESVERRAKGLAKELDELARYHRAVLQQLPVGLATLTPAGRFLIWNRAMEEITGLSSMEVMGLTPADLPEPWDGILGALLDPHQRLPRPVPVDLEGGRRWLELRRASLRGGAPSPRAGEALLVADVTREHALQERIAHRERLMALGEVAAGMAHEIGNPAAAVGGLVHELEAFCEAPQARELLAEVHVQIGRIREILEMVSRYAHSGTGEYHAYGPVDLGQCLRGAVRLVEISRKRQGVLIDCECPERALVVLGQGESLTQVFVNLIKNAVEAGPADQPVVVSLTWAGKRARVRVVDHGPGIDPALRARVFQPFFTTKPAGQGTGLGLALAQRIVEAHGGWIEIKDAAGGGCIFEVTLPLIDEGARR